METIFAETILGRSRSLFRGTAKSSRNKAPLPKDRDQTTGFGHVGIHHQPDLRSVLQQISGGRGAASAPVDLAARAARSRAETYPAKPNPDKAAPMLAEKLLLLLETLKSRTYPDGSPRVVSTSPHVPIKLPGQQPRD
jgi:hypothetical protein